VPGELRCIVRGGGDLATGVVWRLQRCGYDVVVTELAEPLTIRRTVAVSSAVRDGVVEVEGLIARRATVDRVGSTLAAGEVPILVAPTLGGLVADLGADVVVDARLAKRVLDTTITDAGLVIALGPGHVAGRDCHAVVETNRGHRLGRVIWHGTAEADTGVPGLVAGRGAERVLRAPIAGRVEWAVSIGDIVDADEPLGRVAHDASVAVIASPFRGTVRGLIAPGTTVHAGLKVADVDPREDPAACHEISDKALAIGGGVLEAVGRWRSGR
jgi:xanthine dehydrogenase accessory factor